jgi:hypothetical protein
MRRILRYAFVGVLSLALSASGATLGLAHMAAHGTPAEHAHHGSHHADHGQHAHHHGVPVDSDKAPPPTSDHPSKNCCSACTVASPLPRLPDAAVELIVSQAMYSSLKRLDVSFAIPIDPGIPKRIG